MAELLIGPVGEADEQGVARVGGDGRAHEAFGDVLVTNGGYGATQQALAAGVPAVVAGASEDKPATAARVAYHGVGIDLGTQRPEPDQVRTAVRTVLGDGEYSDRTATPARAYARYDAADLIASLAEAPA